MFENCQFIIAFVTKYVIKEPKKKTMEQLNLTNITNLFKLLTLMNYRNAQSKLENTRYTSLVITGVIYS